MCDVWCISAALQVDLLMGERKEAKEMVQAQADTMKAAQVGTQGHGTAAGTGTAAGAGAGATPRRRAGVAEARQGRPGQAHTEGDRAGQGGVV